MLEIPPEVKRINQQLIDHFGIHTSTGQAMWRVVWSEDQYEYRLMDTTDEGLILIHPEVRLVPKYRQWIPEKWVLERLVVVPDLNSKELAGLKLSFEPMFPFEDKNGNGIPANFEACKFVIDLVYASQGKKSMRRYLEEEGAEERVKKLQEELFGNDTDVSDALTYGSGIVVPSGYKKES